MRSAEGIKSSTVAKAHVKLALLTDSLLRLQEARKRLVSPQLVETVMSNVFEGMQRLSPAARDRFPRLLELVAQFPDTQARFTRMAKAVPSWMFIRWISQMMAVLDKPEAGAVVPILLEIAKCYPQALYYPFRIRYVT
jgi:DNA-dependent protein kinase catalytic subunit